MTARPWPRPWRRLALDYGTGRRGDAETPPGAAAVVIPVHGAAAEFRACLESVLRRTNLRHHRLVVVLDGPGQEHARRSVAEAADPADQVTVVENPVRLGFAASVNRGVATTGGDVVLLNSDTVVSAGWLEKLQAAAYSAAEVASVTPFSNNATLCSLPEPFEANLLPAGHDLESFARLVERVSRREYPRLPSGVGMCLYLKRRAWEQLGAFDESMSPGYGEENEFCMRALKAGFVHVLDDATFIYHAGHRSFGGSRRRLMARAARNLRRRHPEYYPTVAAFMRDDPLAAARDRVLQALAASVPDGPAPSRARLRPRRVLHVVHGWPPFSHGGTEIYARTLAQQQSLGREVTVHARRSDPQRPAGSADELRDGRLRVRLVVNDFTSRSPLARNALLHGPIERDFAFLLDNWRPGLVHVHHLAGHAANLMAVVAARGVPLVYQLQDWWPLCARTNLALPDGRLCPGPSPGPCSSCFELTRLPPAGLPNRLLHSLRRALMHRSLRLADAFVAGSRFIVETYRRWGLLRPGDNVHVLPYGVARPAHPAGPRRPLERPVRFGYVGTLMPHKGVHVAVEAFAGQDPGQATFDVWGQTAGDVDYAARLRAAAGPAVRFHGSFPEDDKQGVFARIDVLLVPSVGLESFGIVAREALATGVPVVVSRLGALAELVAGGGGASFTAGDAGELRAIIESLVQQPGRVAAWALRGPAPKDLRSHADEIEDVYAEVLERRGAATSRA